MIINHIGGTPSIKKTQYLDSSEINDITVRFLSKICVKIGLKLIFIKIKLQFFCLFYRNRPHSGKHIP